MLNALSGVAMGFIPETRRLISLQAHSPAEAADAHDPAAGDAVANHRNPGKFPINFGISTPRKPSPHRLQSAVQFSAGSISRPFVDARG
jgi:hypothetical protein